MVFILINALFSGFILLINLSTPPTTATADWLQ